MRKRRGDVERLAVARDQGLVGRALGARPAAQPPHLLIVARIFRAGQSGGGGGSSACALGITQGRKVSIHGSIPGRPVAIHSPGTVRGR